MQLLRAFSWLVSSPLYWALLALSIGLAGNSGAAAPEGADRPPGFAEPHIAVLLPLHSSSFAKHAESVRQGILNAANSGPPNALKVKVYSTNDDPAQILSAYQRATSMGASAVIGPLTRGGVTSLAQSGIISVPTLALNTPEGGESLARDLFVFGLNIEMETRQLARFALRQHNTKAFLIASDSALSGRIAQAFTEEWESHDAKVTGRFTYASDPAALAGLREQVAYSGADIVFLALDSGRARFVRSFLAASTAIFATSMVFTSTTDALANFDLEGVRFLDMPWLLQPDHPAVISYSRPDVKRAALDQERLYALGIDAYRLVQELLRPYEAMAPLDGVTGTITLDNSRLFARALVPAQFSQGIAKALEVPPAR